MADNKSNVLEVVRADDFVEYYLFPPIHTDNELEQETILKQLVKDIDKITVKYTSDYIWHRDGFALTAKTTLASALIIEDSRRGRSTEDNNVDKTLPPHLYGISHVGDNIEDEWFIVFILQQITRHIKELIVRVCDADGEFILIEAADYLPHWADPDTAENRVYICDGKIHIIPPSPPEENDPNNSDEASTPTIITIAEAVSSIQNNPALTLASSDIQNAISNKVQGYPDKIKSSLHRTTVYLPVGVATILKHRPQLIAAAVQAFCNRDTIDMKACNAMKYFPPENRFNVSVTFTKCLYAMLMHSKYVPDRRVGWDLPPAASDQFKSHNLGVKVACGFEILRSQAKLSHNDDSLENDKSWHNYLANLIGKNYFRGLLEHSRDYNNLLNKAKEYYISHRDSMHSTPAVGEEIRKLAATLDYKLDVLRSDEKHLPKDDDDSWLTVSPDELDQLLREQYGQKEFVKINKMSNAGDFSEKLSTFLNHVSDVDGAEFPIRPPRGNKRRGGNKVSFSNDIKHNNNINNNATSDTNNKMNFDPDSFASAVQNILNFVIPEDDSWNLDSDSDMSDYAEDNYVNQTSCSDEKIEMNKYMEEMDRELAATSIGESFEKKVNGDSFEDIECFKPVDIDVNALKNILESYKAQLGEAGPSSNMLGPMGIHLDANENDARNN